MTDYRQMLIDRAKEAGEVPDLERTDHMAHENRRNYIDWQRRRHLHSLGYPPGTWYPNSGRWWRKLLT